MFGYIVPDLANLSDDEKRSFHAAYCGLCKALRDRYGLLSGLTISYDLTFVALLLSSLGDDDEWRGMVFCPVRPFRRMEARMSPILSYVADVNILLAYYKLLDDWQDDRNLGARAASGLMERAVKDIQAREPALYSAIATWIREVSTIERRQKADVDALANSTGRMMGKLLAQKADDPWKDVLFSLGNALGRFIYIMDAYCDLEDDLRKNRYNPLKGLFDPGEHEELCATLLKTIAGEIALAFEMLPLVEDAGLLKNILYSGIWSRYSEVHKKHTMASKGQ